MATVRSATPLISVIIPFHGHQPYMQEQLDAVLSNDYEGGFEVLLADNGADAGTRMVAERSAALHSRVRHVLAAERPGVAWAFRQARVAARGDLLARCDADDVVEPGWLTGLAAAAVAADIVGGRCDVAKLNKGAIRGYRECMTLDRLPVDVTGRPFAVGANAAYWADAWDQLGGYCPNLYPAEDPDLCTRAQRDHRLRVTYAPHAVVNYRHRGDVRGIARQARTYGAGNARSQSMDGHPLSGPPMAWWALKGVLPKISRRPVREQALAWVWRSQMRAGLTYEVVRPRAIVSCPCHPRAANRRRDV